MVVAVAAAAVRLSSYRAIKIYPGRGREEQNRRKEEEKEKKGEKKFVKRPAAQQLNSLNTAA